MHGRHRAALQPRQHEHVLAAVAHLAEIIRDGYEKYDGFVIAHGTDTMAYAAATMSYLVQGI